MTNENEQMVEVLYEDIFEEDALNEGISKIKKQEKDESIGWKDYPEVILCYGDMEEDEEEDTEYND
jgi:hypothetical protein